MEVIMLDYASLKLIWWGLVGVLFAGFAIMDGHDMGVGTLLPFVGRDDMERRVVINTVGPHWDGNQVWFILAGGAIFAAWPLVYATAFSGFYWAMLVVLWALFFRPVGFDYRSKLPMRSWRNSWDWGLFIGSSVPPLVLGVAFGNLLQGLPFQLDSNMVSTYTGSFWALFNPFALLSGVIGLAMVTFHGAIYLVHRTEGAVQARSRTAARVSGLLVLIAFTLAGAWISRGINGFVVTSVVDPGELANPLSKTVVRQMGGWMDNYHQWPLIWALPVSVYAGITLSMILQKSNRTGWAFVTSSVSLLGVIGTAGASMFPFIMPSSIMPSASLTVWDSVSSEKTLTIMLVAALIFVPLIIFYTGWAYRVMGGKVTAARIQKNEHSAY